MKAGVIFTGTGPILILTTFPSFEDPKFLEKMNMKGIKKFLAFEVSEDLCRKKYGQGFDVIMKDVKQTDDLRVLDYNGHNVFYNFTFAEMGVPIEHEAHQ
ncbi:MAG: hypothetical protein HQK59_05500 [Deltaproteobacteria bacterium]|nr:hypothetical protein [Deltaproteobacteria bacterium]